MKALFWQTRISCCITVAWVYRRTTKEGELQIYDGRRVKTCLCNSYRIFSLRDNTFSVVAEQPTADSGCQSRGMEVIAIDPRTNQTFLWLTGR